MELAKNRWFSSWFDTPYYHILYKNRGEDEAEEFMKNLVGFLEIPEGATILDLACGKGRHARFLHSLGYDVTGVDLSANSIQHAKKFEQEQLQFHTHCMCKPFGNLKYDAVFNLFTSLGYFENEQENLESICAIKEQIKSNGWGVIDFMNVKKVIKNLVPSEVKQVKGIEFNISRRVENGYIFKDIEFEDKGEEYAYTEKVKALTLDRFKFYFEKAEIDLKYTFGNYHLEGFDEQTSDRLILVFQ